MEENETPEEAVRRELFEELSVEDIGLKYWGEFSFTPTDPVNEQRGPYEFHIFIAPISPELLKAKVSEGESLVLMPIDDVIRGEGFTAGMTEFVKKLKSDLQKEINIGRPFQII